MPTIVASDELRLSRAMTVRRDQRAAASSVLRPATFWASYALASAAPSIVGCATERIELAEMQNQSGVKPDSGSPAQGCQKVDFLFVVDNSNSMQEEQENLARSFPGFIDVLEGTLSARDYHIMVVDTDASGGRDGLEELPSLAGGDLTCEPAPACCYIACGLSFVPGSDISGCNTRSCAEVLTDIPDPCEGELGAGKRLAPDGESCGVMGPQRYMVQGQPELAETFACTARVGTFGAGGERLMAAVAAALSPLQNGPGGCNEGFVRDDAMLVLTFITDEDDQNSPGDPAVWRQVVLDAKHGNEQAITVLGLVGDGNIPGGLPGGPCTGQASPAPLLQEFVQSFHFGSMGSVCATDYAPFLENAVAEINTACIDFEPIP